MDVGAGELILPGAGAGGDIPAVGVSGAIGEGVGLEIGTGLIEGLSEGDEDIIGVGDETGETAGGGVMTGGGVDMVGGVETPAGGIVGGDDVGP